MRTKQSMDSLTLCFSLRFSMSLEMQKLNNHNHLYLTLDSGVLHGYVFVHSDIENKQVNLHLDGFQVFRDFSLLPTIEVTSPNSTSTAVTV